MKAHLASGFDGPLSDGRTYFAICGLPIENAQIKFFFDDDFRSLAHALKSTQRVCPKCIAASIFLDDGLVYGIVSAKKLPDSEREMEEAVA
jgi:hypothetical protein